MAVSPALGTTAVTSTANITSRQGGIRKRAMEHSTILYVTKEGVYAREAIIFTVIREPKSDSTLNKAADTRTRPRKGGGDHQKGEQPLNQKCTSNMGITGWKGGSIVADFGKGRN
jgi:hypothetical protein